MLQGTIYNERGPDKHWFGTGGSPSPIIFNRVLEYEVRMMDISPDTR